MNKITISQLIKDQRMFFSSHKTKDIPYRIEQLKKLKKVILENESHIIAALQKDLHKPEIDAYFSAVYLCVKEINYALKCIKCWSKKQPVKTPLSLWPMRSALKPQPYGVVLIISTWNYPFNLNILPLIGAIAAGNCVVIKPSHRATASEQLLVNMINNSFAAEYIHVVEGGPEVADELIEQKWDYIFLTGNTGFAKKVMHNAAEHLIPVSLELGGKSPCIVDDTASIDLAAKKIAWGKWLNIGQNCISPDYLLVHKQIKNELITALKKYIAAFYGTDPQQSASYGRIIDPQQMQRLVTLMEKTNIIFGGTINEDDLYIAPTLVEVDSLEHPIMQEEIFGPILPIITFETLDEALTIYNHNPQPLAVYLFSTDKKIQHRIEKETTSGAFGINEMVLQVCSNQLPFGGIGHSGMGRYHGKATFDTFSNYRAIIESGWLELPFRYPNYARMQQLFKKILQWFS